MYIQSNSIMYKYFEKRIIISSKLHVKRESLKSKENSKRDQEWILELPNFISWIQFLYFNRIINKTSFKKIFVSNNKVFHSSNFLISSTMSETIQAELFTDLMRASSLTYPNLNQLTVLTQQLIKIKRICSQRFDN